MIVGGARPPPAPLFKKGEGAGGFFRKKSALWEWGLECSFPYFSPFDKRKGSEKRITILLHPIFNPPKSLDYFVI